MIKKNKWRLLVSSVVILLPIVFGLFMWESLPEQMVTHWGLSGEADGESSRWIAVFSLPVLMLITHWICIFFTSQDAKNKDQNKKVFGMIFWIVPAISIVSSAVIYMTAFGKEFEMQHIEILVIGLMFVVIGNYLPKCKQNQTIGVKVIWALRDEENWNKTHRFCGKLWVIGGVLFILSAFLPDSVIPYVLTILMILLAVIPVMYSYLFYKKQLKEGKEINLSQNTKAAKIGWIITVIILAGVTISLFTGEIKLKYSESSFTIVADYWYDLTVDYGEIDSVEYRDEDTPGDRTNGYGSMKLLMGAFRNGEFGNYTRYSYVKCDSCIVIVCGEKILVLNGADEESTKEIYHELTERISEE